MSAADQRMQALDAANQIRVDRALLASRIQAGEVRAYVILGDLPACMKGCAAFTFLTYMRGVGRKRTEGRAFVLLRRARVPGHKRLDDLTPIQLERLTLIVREYEEGWHPAERGLT